MESIDAKYDYAFTGAALKFHDFMRFANHVKSEDNGWMRPTPIRDTSFRTDRKIDFTFNEKPEKLPDRSIKFKRSYEK